MANCVSLCLCACADFHPQPATLWCTDGDGWKRLHVLGSSLLGQRSSLWIPALFPAPDDRSHHSSALQGKPLTLRKRRGVKNQEWNFMNSLTSWEGTTVIWPEGPLCQSGQWAWPCSVSRPSPSYWSAWCGQPPPRTMSRHASPSLTVSLVAVSASPCFSTCQMMSVCFFFLISSFISSRREIHIVFEKNHEQASWWWYLTGVWLERRWSDLSETSNKMNWEEAGCFNLCVTSLVRVDVPFS